MKSDTCRHVHVLAKGEKRSAGKANCAMHALSFMIHNPRDAPAIGHFVSAGLDGRQATPLFASKLKDPQMIVSHPAELDGLKAIGRICANTVQLMARSMEHGMTTAELDEIGRAYLEKEGALSAPRSTYKFPGTTCISVNEEVAHGIPGKRILKNGDLVNIDVSASKDGFFADTGASFGLGTIAAKLDKLCRDGQRAMDVGIAEVVAGAPLSNIGKAVGHFAKRGGYTLIQNLASHGVGRSLHEYPEEVATWPNRDKRIIADGLVLTVEPFLSLGGREAIDWDEDDWTLFAYPARPTVQYEHTVVATQDGPLIVTLADI